MTMLETIPSGFTRLGFTDPQFCKWQGELCAIGPADNLPVNKQVMVTRRNGEEVSATVVEHVAERVVTRRQQGSYLASIGQLQVRYVVARIMI